MTDKKGRKESAPACSVHFLCKGKRNDDGECVAAEMEARKWARRQWLRGGPEDFDFLLDDGKVVVAGGERGFAVSGQGGGETVADSEPGPLKTTRDWHSALVQFAEAEKPGGAAGQ
jgi:hypothetical protein